jgi:hypothetical protein
MDDYFMFSEQSDVTNQNEIEMDRGLQWWHWWTIFHLDMCFNYNPDIVISRMIFCFKLKIVLLRVETM